MQYLAMKRNLTAAFIICTVGYAGLCSADGISNPVTMDADGISGTFTGLARITCGDATDHLIARIIDRSPPIPSLLVNLQLYKGEKAISITDTISGDAEFSPWITLQGGPGSYWLIVNKTGKGARLFDVQWHCRARDSVHTDTEIDVKQFGEPEFISE